MTLILSDVLGNDTRVIASGPTVPTDLTGSDSERELLARELENEMSASILRRIDAATRELREAAQ